MTTFKMRCVRCKKNYVLATLKTRFPSCSDCQAKELEGEITDPEMKKFFNIPQEYYKNNTFIADIKIKYLKWGNLTDRQKDAFKKAVEEMKLREKNV